MERMSGIANPGSSQFVGLHTWQLEACDAWVHGDDAGPFRGTLEVFTGGGKSLIALECWRRAVIAAPGLRAAVVVPTLALARQWRGVILNGSDLTNGEIGSLDGTRKDDLSEKRFLVCVLNTASQVLPEMAEHVHGPIMLIVDECHRAGARQFSRVLDTRAEFRLGLSATAEREDVDDAGNPIEYDEHVLGRKLGQIVYGFDLRKAREIGWLPQFTVYHHAIELSELERKRYEEMSRKIDDIADRLSDVGVERSIVRNAMGREGEIGGLARAYVAAVSMRKDLLYRAEERARVVGEVLKELPNRIPAPKTLLFHERIVEADRLFVQLRDSETAGRVGLEHSQLPEDQRRKALAAFGQGQVDTLVSVKSLVEGIDVPDADVGISVASSASVRQRVQALGRVLRRRFDGTTKVAEMHILYVADSADEAIYGKEDWSDLTGDAPNRYGLWKYGSVAPIPLDGPPLTPKPTEEEFWLRLGERMPLEPVEWTPAWPVAEWRLDGRGTVTDLEGRIVTNPQGAVEAVRKLKPTGGRFRVSRLRRFLVVPEGGPGGATAWLVGSLEEPFQVEEPVSEDVALADAASANESHLVASRSVRAAGSVYEGPSDKEGGTYRIRQKAGGVIERKVGRDREFALLVSGGEKGELVANAKLVLEAWKATGESGLEFHVNARGDAFYLSGGQRRFLAHIPGGFAWPE
jgi:superfamily II DNA or RNA helicase